MNYGKDNLDRRRKNISSQQRMQKKRVGVRFFKALVICVLLVAVLCVGGVGFFVKRIVDASPNVTPDDVKPSGFVSTVVSEDGTKLEEFVQSGSNRVYVTIDKIPPYLGDAFVAIEDSRFYKHNGVDLQGVLRAAAVGLTSGNFSEGASTLTQQLIKNNVFPNFVHEHTFYASLERKIQEQYIALQIEKKMSKSEILEAYMNTINLGQSCLGVEAASQRYFGKTVTDLNLSECAVLAGITQNPTKYDPVNHPDQNAKRRKIVLDNMLDQGYISQSEHDDAMADNVYDRIIQAAPAENNNPYSYFNDALFQQLIEDLQTRKGYSENQAYNAVLSGGLTIVSTQDTNIQTICDEEVANDAIYPAGTEYGLEYALTVTRTDGTVENYSKEMLAQYISGAWGREYPLLFSSPDEANQAVAEYKSTLGIAEGDTIDERIEITPQPQTSVVVMEQSTGKVKAIVGGRGTKTTSLSLNRATDSTRQPGSCFKILSTYAPALDEKNYTLATSIPDQGPFKYANGKGTVENWDKIYIGSARVRYAIEHSMNVCAVETLTNIGVQTGYDELIKFGFTTLVDGTDENYPGFTDIQQPTALGGITRGVYNLEMTAAYAAIANKGTYIKPYLYTQVKDHDGNVLLDNTTPDSHQVIKDSTAFLLTSAMEDVINKGTGTAAKLNTMPAAGKTGTTENSTDLWLSAYTPYYTASVWGGYDSSKTMEGMNQAWHEVLWKNIMERIHQDLPVKQFSVPSSVQQKTICTITGQLATSSCPTLTEYFAAGTAPTQTCPGHYSSSSSSSSSSSGDSEEKKSEDSKTDENSSSNNNSSESGDNSGSQGSGDGSSDNSQQTPDSGNSSSGDAGGGDSQE